MHNARRSTRSSKTFDFAALAREVHGESERSRLESQATHLLRSRGLCKDGRTKSEHSLDVPLVYNNNGPRH